LPGFENEGFFLNKDVAITGSLLNPCIDEVKGTSMKTWLKWMGENKGKDSREGHISNCNHPILSEKLFQSIKHKKPLDLRTGFKKGFLI